MKRVNYMFIFLLITFFSCNNIPKEIINTPLYKDVISHYEHTDINREKKDAALFLFKNMDQKYSILDTQIDSILTFIADSIEKKEVLISRKELIAASKQKSFKTSSPEIIIDYSVIKSNDLISHIDITYNSWKQLSEKSDANFKDYCEFILPYRIKNEPAFELQTEYFHDKLHSFSDTLARTDSIVPAISNLIKSLRFRVDNGLSKHYPNLFSAKQVFTLKSAPVCDDFAISLSIALRSIGIPATYDYLPQWGNHHSVGHSWLAIKWQHKWYGFDAVDGTFVNQLFHNDNIPKIFRQTYSLSKGKNKIDVTSEYRDISDLQVTIDEKLFSRDMQPAVAIFNKKRGFRVVDYGRKERTSLIFKNLGRNVIYFIGGLENDKFTPLTNPVFLDSLGHTNYLIPNWNTTGEYTLERKHPLTRGYTSVISRRKERWAKSISESWIEVSNNNFITVDTLIAFRNYNSYKENNYQTNTEKPYKAVRISSLSSKEANIATLKFFSREQNLLTGQIIHNLEKGFNPEKLFDSDMLTATRQSSSEKIAFVGLRFNPPQFISSISVHTRNDGNHIIPGDNYELMVYNSGWQSLGLKTADKQELNYVDVPSSGLYWLKNLSQGKEELPFVFDSNKNQFWPGQ
ncbi:transglutaminase domain-containing protein [Formosa sp. 4Alg 33]|uniref:transglutaminase domain-containing protein n=1 Tax=Formosa sp. 4Alg 33 TaxID=3382189 RepID=UPI003D9C61BE